MASVEVPLDSTGYSTVDLICKELVQMAMWEEQASDTLIWRPLMTCMDNLNTFFSTGWGSSNVTS